MGNPVFAQPGTSRTYEILGDRATIQLGGAETGGALAVVRLETPPGGGPPPHVHAKEDETFVVLEGTLSFFMDGSWHDVSAGGAVFLPRGRAHTFRNRTPTTARSIMVGTPAGFDRFVVAIATEAVEKGVLDPARIAEISAPFGITYPKIELPA